DVSAEATERALSVRRLRQYHAVLVLRRLQRRILEAQPEKVRTGDSQAARRLQAASGSHARQSAAAPVRDMRRRVQAHADRRSLLLRHLQTESTPEGTCNG